MKKFKNIIFLTAFIICGIICLPCQLKAFAAAAENENFARLNNVLQLLIDDNKNGMPGPESANAGAYSGMYLWEEKVCSAILNNAFPEL